LDRLENQHSNLLMKNTRFLIVILVGFLLACEPQNPYLELQKALQSNLPESTFQSYMNLNPKEFEKLVEEAILADCPSEEMGEQLKEIQRVEAGRKMMAAKSELSDAELIALIEAVKNGYKVRKAALCW
jgi:hypothetical protein